MDSLILHLSGPLQSWGAAGRFDLRDTYTMPTKSAIVGFLAACVGIPRGGDVTELSELRVALRSDRRGVALRDYHTVGPGSGGRRGRTAEGKPRRSAIVTERWYLADAGFTVAVGGTTGEVDALTAAVTAPRFAPFLGRRCCVPDPVWFCGVLRGVDPGVALREVVPLVGTPDRERASVRVVIDDPTGKLHEVNDRPDGELDRRYGRRHVRDETVDLTGVGVVGDALELFAELNEVCHV
jgi:CRISPR system Cascade subunit CasD